MVIIVDNKRARKAAVILASRAFLMRDDAVEGESAKRFHAVGVLLLDIHERLI